MKCRNVQQWLLLRDKYEDKPPRFEAHLESCAACRAFQKRVTALKLDLVRVESPEPSEQLIRDTRNQCHELIRLNERDTAAETPKWIPAAAGLWMLVTLVLIGLGLFQSDSEWNIQRITAFVLLIQNGLMLLFSPILLSSVDPSIRFFKKRRNSQPNIINLSCL